MLTLVVEISREGNKLKMSAFERARGIDVTLKHYNECILELKEIEFLCEEITNLFNKAIRKKDSGDNFSDDLKKIGRALFDQLLTLEAKKAIKNTKASFLLISIDEHLVQIPWELLHDGVEFLCIRFAMGRSVRTQQKAYESKFRDINIPIKMLIVADPTGDLNSAYEEGISIRDELDKRKNKVKVLSKTGEVYTDFIKRNIRDYDVIHFAGHAEYNLANLSESGWFLKDGKFTAREIVALGTTAPMPSIVFSNACQSGKTQEWEIKKGFEDEIFGLANAFLLAGVRHYIGTFWKVLDKTCLDFSNEFYKNVTDGLPIGEAVRLARIKLINKYGYSSIIWSSYMLYGDPSVNLFFMPGSRKVSKDIVFQKQVMVLSIILGSIIGTGILGFVLYKNYILKPSEKTGISWAQKNIIAVMPFENLTKEKETDWMGNGIADVIAMKMSRVKKINVVDKTQVENIWREIRKTEYIDKESALKIANILGVDKVISGAFQKIGNDIRVTANLINVKDGALIGTTDVTNNYNNLFTLEDSIALNIIEKLNLKITDSERAEFKKLIPTNNISAFEFNAKATNAFNLKDIQGALKFCKKALEEDPNYIGANLSAAFLYEWSGDMKAAKHYYERVQELAEAKTDKPSLMMANFNLGRIAFGELKTKEALNYQNKALNISKYLKDQQAYAQIILSIGLCYMQDNDFDKAKKMIIEGKEIFEKLNNKFFIAESYIILGLYYSFGKDMDLAKKKESFEKAYSIYEELNVGTGLAKASSSLGNYYFSIGDYDEAITYFMKSLKISKDLDNNILLNLSYMGLGDSYLQKGEYGNAQEYYEKRLDLNKISKNPTGIKNALYSLSSLCLMQLRYDEALKYLEAFVEQAKEDSDHRNEALGLQIIGRIYVDTGRFEEAIQKYNVALSYKDELGQSQNILREIYFGLGLSNDKLGRVQERDQYFNLSLEIAKNKEGMTSLGYLYSTLGKFYEDGGEIKKAIEYYKQAIEALDKVQSDMFARSSFVSAYNGLAGCYKKQNNKFEAIKYYKLALAIAEEIKSPMVENIKSNLYSMDEEVKDEKDEIINNEALALYNQANFLYAAGENEKAIIIANDALKKDPTSNKIINLICLIYENSGKFEEAINTHLQYIKSLEAEKDNLKIISRYSWIGFDYFHIGRLDKAQEYYEKALTLAKVSGDKKSMISIYVDYGKVLNTIGREERALEFINKAIELCKDEQDSRSLADAYYVLSIINSKRNNKEKALEYALASTKINEESGSINLGQNYAQVGNIYKEIDIVKSLEYLNKAVEFFKNKNQLSSLGNAYNSIGSIYYKMQQNNKAIESYIKSLEISGRLNDKWTTLSNYSGLEEVYFEIKNYKLSEEFGNKYIELCKEMGREEELGYMYAIFADRFKGRDSSDSEKFLLMSTSILEKYKSSKSIHLLFLNYFELGNKFSEKKDSDNAIIYFNKARSLGEKEDFGDKIVLAGVYHQLGECYLAKGEINKALESYKEAKSINLNSGIEGRGKLVDLLDNQIEKLEFFISIEDKIKDYDNLVNKGTNYYKEQKWELALEYYNKALSITRELKSRNNESLFKDMSEREKWLSNEISKIDSYLKEVEKNQKAKPAEYLNANAILYVRQNRLEAALENFKKALEIYQGIDDKDNIVLSKLRIGLVYLTMNDIKNTESLLADAKALSKTINNSESIGLIHGAYGILFEKTGKYDKAIEEFNNAMGFLQGSQYLKTYIAAYNNCLGSVYYKKKNYSKSLESYKKALEINKDAEDPNSISITETMLAYIYLINNMLQEADDSINNALVIAEKIDDKDLSSICSLIKGKISMKQNNFEKSNEFFNKAATYADLSGNGKLKVISYSNLAILAKKQSEKGEYEKWLGIIKSEDNFGCLIAGDISTNREESLFREVIEEKDFFKRIWL